MKVANQMDPMEVIEFDQVFRIDCGEDYLDHIGNVFQDISRFTNAYKYCIFTAPKRYLYVDREENFLVETDDFNEIAHLVDGSETEIFASTYIFANKPYTNAPIRMIFETYQHHISELWPYLQMFYDWASISIVVHSVVRDPTILNGIMIESKIEPLAYICLLHLPPLTIRYHDIVYRVANATYEVLEF